LLLAAPALAQFDAPSTLDKPQAGFYRLKLGKVDVIAVNDGAASFDVLGVVTPTRKSDAATIMANSLVTSPVQASVNAYVILIGNKTILVDAGTDELFGVKLGKLADSLRAAGIQAESVTDILVTHIHPSSSSGATPSTRQTRSSGIRRSRSPSRSTSTRRPRRRRARRPSPKRRRTATSWHWTTWIFLESAG
jgi:glyoxylase-like metal-dependent hydrolase (beta-lactamase superfamily II)